MRQTSGAGCDLRFIFNGPTSIPISSPKNISVRRVLLFFSLVHLMVLQDIIPVCLTRSCCCHWSSLNDKHRIVTQVCIHLSGLIILIAIRCVFKQCHDERPTKQLGIANLWKPSSSSGLIDTRAPSLLPCHDMSLTCQTNLNG